MNTNAKRLKNKLIKDGFSFDNDVTFIKNLGNGILCKIYTFNSEIGLLIGTLNLNYWEDGYNIKKIELSKNASFEDIKILINDYLLRKAA